jgi:hypothetical protein
MGWQTREYGWTDMGYNFNQLDPATLIMVFSVTYTIYEGLKLDA